MVRNRIRDLWRGFYRRRQRRTHRHDTGAPVVQEARARQLISEDFKELRLIGI